MTTELICLNGRFESFTHNYEESNWKRGTVKINDCVGLPFKVESILQFQRKRNQLAFTGTTFGQLVKNKEYTLIGTLQEFETKNRRISYSLDAHQIITKVLTKTDLWDILQNTCSKEQVDEVREHYSKQSVLRTIYDWMTNDELPFSKGLAMTLKHTFGNPDALAFELYYNEIKEHIKEDKKLAKKIIHQYGEKSKDQLAYNPWELMSTCRLSLAICDQIACSYEHPENVDPLDNPLRQQAILKVMILEYLDKDGSTIIPYKLLPQAYALSPYSKEMDYETFLEKMKELYTIRQTKAGYQPTVYAELENEIMQLVAPVNEEKPLSYTEDDLILPSFTLNKEQKTAVLKTINHFFTLLTGGPGTGKTTITKIILDNLQHLRGFEEEDILLLAPTGKAAERLTEVTGFSAQTIHSAFHLKPGTLFQDSFTLKGLKKSLLDTRPLIPKQIVVDECSMLDIFTAGVIATYANEFDIPVLMIGDSDQLPSIGNGQILKDIEGLTKYKTHLIQIMRQGKDSGIPELAQMIHNGMFPDEAWIKEQKDIFFIPCNNEDTLEYILKAGLKNKEIPTVLSPYVNPQPTTKGKDTVFYLNKLLQHIRLGFEPTDLFYEEDPVIFTQNNPCRKTANGTRGIVTEKEMKDDSFSVTVAYKSGNEDKETIVQPDELNEITLAYAMSIHKSQGSEYKSVTLPILRNTEFVNRNLLYTAITRAKEKLILIGNITTFKDAAARQMRLRKTGLNQERKEK